MAWRICCLVSVISVGVNLELLRHRTAEFRFRKHALDGKLDDDEKATMKADKEAAQAAKKAEMEAKRMKVESRGSSKRPSVE